MRRLLLACLLIGSIVLPVHSALGGDAGPGKRTAALMESMRDPDPMVRRAAAVNLGETGDAAAAPLLADVLKNDPDVLVRLNALGALDVIGGDLANIAFESAFADPDERVRQSAAQALSGSWGQSAHKALVEALEHDKSAKVRRCVAEALGNPGIMGRYSAHQWDGTAITQKALVEALGTDPDYGVRTTAAQMLGRFKNDVSFKALMKAVEKDTSVSVRASAAEALGSLDMKAAIPRLLEIVSFERDEMLVMSALKALKYYDDPAMAAPLIAALESASPKVRWQAIDVLEELRSNESVDFLTRISEDEFEPEGVRFKAKEALQKMGVQ